PPLDRTSLNRVRDNERLPRDFENSEQGLLEVQAYDEAVVNAARTPASVFFKSVRPEITYVQLIETPGRYRGEVVRIDGRLARVVQHDTLRMVEQAGVKHTYEVWLFSDHYRDREGKANPALLICPSIPAGIPLAEKVEKDVAVTFVGYFFKN